MVELDLTRAKQFMQDVATVLSKLLGGSSTSGKRSSPTNVSKPQTFEELKAAVNSINSGVDHAR